MYLLEQNKKGVLEPLGDTLQLLEMINNIDEKVWKFQKNPVISVLN